MPADYTSPPLAFNINQMLAGAGLWPDANTAAEVAAWEQAAHSVAAAVAEFERRTGWIPFVAGAGAVATTRYFDATDYYGYLDLNGAAQSISSITVAGSVRTVDTEYWTRPANAAGLNEAITGIEFRVPYGSFSPWGRRNQIAITAVWGRFAVWPPDAWEAIKKRAAIGTLTAIETPNKTISYSEGGVSEAFDPVQEITPQNLFEEWPKEFEQAVTRHMRVVV